MGRIATNEQQELGLQDPTMPALPCWELGNRALSESAFHMENRDLQDGRCPKMAVPEDSI